MKILNCPLNGARNIAEFLCFGEVRHPPDAGDDDSWADYVWSRDNLSGVVREWWCHVPSTYWFIAERDTETDEVLRTYPASVLFEGERRA
jgi:sarcosine oxidase subunit delta